MNATTQKPQGTRVIWLNVVTVISAAILIGAEVFGAAFAGGWALESLTGFGNFLVGLVQSLVSLVGVEFSPPESTGVHVLQAFFFLVGVAVMARFIVNARLIEPFTARD